MITEIKLTIDRRTNDVVSATADNNIVTQDVPKDAGATAIVNHYKTFADPIANQVVGSITASLTRNATPAGESVLGDIIADAQLDATKPSDFGGSVVAFMNPGGIRSDLIYTRTDGALQDVTYGNLFTVQPFGNTVTVKMHGRPDRRSARAAGLAEPVCDSPWWPVASSRCRRASRTPQASAPNGQKVDPASIKIDGVTVGAARRSGDDEQLPRGRRRRFTVFRQCTNQLGGEVDLDAAVRYFQENSPISPTAAESDHASPAKSASRVAAPAAPTASCSVASRRVGGVRDGIRAALPLAVAPLLFGAAFGVLALDAGLGAEGAIAMSATTFAGSRSSRPPRSSTPAAAPPRSSRRCCSTLATSRSASRWRRSSRLAAPRARVATDRR